MKKIFFLFFSFYCINIFSNYNFPVDSIIFQPVTKENREKFKNELRDSIVLKNLNEPVNNSTISKYKEAFRGAELGLIKDTAVYISLKKILKTYILKSFDDSFYRSAVEAAYTIFPRLLEPEIFQVMNLTDNPKLFAMCMNYLMIYSEEVEMHRDYYKKMMIERFPDYARNPILHMLDYKITTKISERLKSRPPITDMLANNYGNDKTIIFSIQRYYRDYPGIVIIKKPDGKFLRVTGDSIFSVPQLARSITNMPGYITNGNTPQGILSIQGIDTSKNVFIGPTPNLQLILPFEDSVKAFFHLSEYEKSDSTLSFYKKLLPESWRSYEPVYETYYAGKAGRSEIISHGTTIDNEFYLNQPYYPQTPSMGCLCCSETWDDNGLRVSSDQQKLIDAYLSTGSNKGYVVVIELDNKKKPVSFSEIKKFILEAESK